jgi:hypothetical protein
MCKTIVKNRLLLSYYSLEMTNTVFPAFQTQYILDFSSASRIAEHWDLPNTEKFQSKDVASGMPLATLKKTMLHTSEK